MSDITVSVTDDTDISLTVSPSADLSSSTTDNLTEGSSNLYHTSERVDDRVNALLQAGSNITLTYDDTANTLTIASTDTEDNLSNNTTDDLAEGSSNLYFTDARVDTALTTVGGHILPAANDTHDLGSPTKQWRELYIGPNSLYVDGVQLISRSADVYDFSTDSGQQIRIQPNNHLTLESISGDVKLRSSGKTDFETGNVEVSSGNVSVTGNITSTGFIQTGGTGLKTDLISDAADIRIETGDTSFLHLDTGNVYVGSFSQAVHVTDTEVKGLGTNPNITANNLTVGGTVSGIDTGDVTEGSNLYFTNARADARITNNILDEDNFASDSATNTASQQSIKAYIATQIATKDNTDEITEGSTNLYFTTARARSSISASGSLAYNSSTGALTYTQGAIDADSVTVSNLEVDNLKSGVLDTDLSSVAGTDTTLASAKAIKAYVDSQSGGIADVVSDTSPQLGGDLDLNSNNITGTGNIDTTGSLTLSGDITGDSGDMTIKNTVDGSNIVLKVDDTGGTTRTPMTLKVDDFQDAGSTAYEGYILQPGLGMKIGDQGEFSANGQSPDNDSANYRINGMIINPTGNTWPSVNLVSTGQSASQNPLNDQFNGAVGSLTQFPNANFLFSAANGTAASPAALDSGKRVGQMGFMVHDGAGFGGSNAVSSATITVTSSEAATTSNARAVNMKFDFLPSGGSGTDGDGTSDRRVVLTMDHDTFQVGTSSNDVTSQFYGNATFEDTVNVSGTLNADGDFTVDGNTTLGNGSSDNITPNGKFTDHLITNNISNLGSSSDRWGFLYAEDINVSIDTTLGRDLTVGRHLQVDGGEIDFTNLPTSDPGISGRLYRSGNDVKISTG